MGKAGSASTSTDILATFIPQVEGRSTAHLNDVLQARCLDAATGGRGKTAIYFGGDVQNLEEDMARHRDSFKYVGWSLENTAKLLLHELKPDGYTEVLVIRPARMERLSFSCFDHFVEGDACGAPIHDDTGVKALEQLVGLLRSLRERDGVVMNKSFALIGFSKGVVVLNQVLHDVRTLYSDERHSDRKELVHFLRCVDSMVWLDGGHNGGKDTWICDESILRTFVERTEVKVDIRVTPYQVRDPRRPWIGKEEKRFHQLLKEKLKIGESRLKRKVYFEDEEPTLEHHFRIITTFKENRLH